MSDHTAPDPADDAASDTAGKAAPSGQAASPPPSIDEGHAESTDDGSYTSETD